LPGTGTSDVALLAKLTQRSRFADDASEVSVEQRRRYSHWLYDGSCGRLAWGWCSQLARLARDARLLLALDAQLAAAVRILLFDRAPIEGFHGRAARARPFCLKTGDLAPNEHSFAFYDLCVAELAPGSGD